jgi:hypothetical protein
MKKTVLIVIATLAAGLSSAYAQSPETSSNHHWKHSHEKIAQDADSFAFGSDVGYRSYPGSVGDEAGDSANSMSGPNDANNNAEGRSSGG